MKITCTKCNSENYVIKTEKKFNMWYDDSYYEEFIYLTCKDCDNKKLIHEVTYSA